MKRPDWLPELGKREEMARAHHGLIPKVDGWYKTFDGRTSYICKPCEVAEVVAVVYKRIEEIRAKRAGQSVEAVPGRLTLDEVADAYRDWLWQRVTTGHPKKLARRTYDDVIRELNDFVECTGGDKNADLVGPSDFSRYAKKHLAGRAPTSIRRKIIYIEAFANWAGPGRRKAKLLSRAWDYGTDFDKPNEDEIARSAADSDKAYNADQVRSAFLAVKRDLLLRAVGWLGLCGAFGAKDMARLPESIVDLSTGVIQFPRGKTGVGRCCWLPPAARLAIKQYVAVRAAPATEAAKGLLLLSEMGYPLYKESTQEKAGYRNDRLGHKWGEKTGLPLSGLRSTFATLADDFVDQRAVDIVMGHKYGNRTRSVRNKNYAKRFSSDRAQRLVGAVLPRAFGRKSPSFVSLSEAGSPQVSQVAPAATPSTPPRQPDQSPSAEPSNQVGARHTPAVPRRRSA